MSITTDIHPDAVLRAVLAVGGRSHRRRNLEQVHEICSKQHAAGSRDFSRSTIGRLCETAGVFKTYRVLYNVQSADYLKIIGAWAAYAGPPAPPPAKLPASHEYLKRIEDPALRFVIQGIISERDRLQAQLNTLKTRSYVTVDRRPLGVTVTSNPSSGPTLVLEKKAQLTASERDALNKAISPAFLDDQGWREGGHGEIFNGHGRVLFEPGFATALRKALGDSK